MMVGGRNAELIKAHTWNNSIKRAMSLVLISPRGEARTSVDCAAFARRRSTFNRSCCADAHEPLPIAASRNARTLNPHASFSNTSYPGISGSCAMLMKKPSICWLTCDHRRQNLNPKMAGRNAPKTHVQARQVSEAGDAQVEVEDMVV